MSSAIPFKQIAVIGAGTMGSGIAGQIANAGHNVLLLDLPADDQANAVTEGAVQRLLKSDPPALMHKSRAELITCGNMRDDFDRLAECDWIIEAVVERLDIKKDLYKRLDAVISADCVVTSNTSTIPISLLVEDMPKASAAALLSHIISILCVICGCWSWSVAAPLMKMSWPGWPITMTAFSARVLSPAMIHLAFSATVSVSTLCRWGSMRR